MARRELQGVAIRAVALNRDFGRSGDVNVPAAYVRLRYEQRVGLRQQRHPRMFENNRAHLQSGLRGLGVSRHGGGSDRDGDRAAGNNSK